jgi:hypothetical protein
MGEDLVDVNGVFGAGDGQELSIWGEGWPEGDMWREGIFG